MQAGEMPIPPGSKPLSMPLATRRATRGAVQPCANGDHHNHIAAIDDGLK